MVSVNDLDRLYKISWVTTINLSFWLSWFTDIVLKENVMGGHEIESHPPFVI